jgi:hypothetical protein
MSEPLIMLEPKPNEPSRYMRTTLMLSAQTMLELPSSDRVRFFSKNEASVLAENVRKRNVFTRHSWENNFYLQRLDELADHTIIEVFRPGDPQNMAEEAEEAAALIEKLAVLSSTVIMTKSELLRKLGISSKRRTEIDFANDFQLRFLRSRQKAVPAVQGVSIDERFRRRFVKCGFHNLVEHYSPENKLAKRVLTSLNWLFESRLESSPQASVVKTSIAMESLLIFSESESLARSLSERVAFILSLSPPTRREISGIIKRFYNARSGVVHGSRKKAKELTPALVESVDRLTLLLCLVIGANYELWPSDDALREWCEDQRWGEPWTTVNIPFPVTYLNNAIALSAKNS